MAKPEPSVKRQTLYMVDETLFMVSSLSNGTYWLHVEASEDWCHIACQHGRWHHVDTFKRSREAQDAMDQLLSR